MQLGADCERERQLSADAEAALARLEAERETLTREAAAGVERRSEVETRVSAAGTTLAASEARFGELTAALADLTAQRGQLEATIRGCDERRTKLEREHGQVTEELEKLIADAARAVDLEGLSAATAAAQEAVAAAEADTLRAEAAQSAARQALDVARQPLAEAERNAQRLETEAKTLARLLHVENKQMWPPVIDLLTVEKGYETALGAALGDDLDAPVEATAPIHWGGAAVDIADPPLPEGVAPLTSFVTAAPDAMARRLAQIGVVPRSEGPRIAGLLKPGQRLVSQEGDLWRWDGFAVAANAPTAAARRLAGRNRLADIEAELRTFRADLDARRQAVAAAESEVAETREAENDARGRWRAAQREADAARDRHAAAERELNRITSRRSALTEAQARVTTTLAETGEARAAAALALEGLAPSAAIEAELADTRTTVGADRVRLAEVRAEAQALAREIEIAERRLAAIAAEAEAWTKRREGAASQIATIEARLEETHTEHTSTRRHAGRVRG